MATVIKPFAYAADGFTVESLVPGDERDFGVATDGLVDEGFIEADAAKADADAPVVHTSKRGK
ncbi:hypothetical protein A4U53_030845 [Rhizobium ruizarguesonis]|uniref:Uncharacterized protein n=2 Tax=Rhizobium TaxID=379 RepID=A0A179BUQ4_RHILE|nr:hypothetical protein [Rhizobium leguminosarum]OAP95105.1 hypothetical protein A4U53_17940 [Rhizobium leguminosarum]